MSIMLWSWLVSEMNHKRNRSQALAYMMHPNSMTVNPITDQLTHSLTY